MAAAMSVAAGVALLLLAAFVARWGDGGDIQCGWHGACDTMHDIAQGFVSGWPQARVEALLLLQTATAPVSRT